MEKIVHSINGERGGAEQGATHDLELV